MAEVDEPPSEVHPDDQEPVTTSVNPVLPAASLADNGMSKRPRDSRLIHMILANLGVNAYQERVPLQLMDFAYRYTSSTILDALHFTTEGYGASGPTSNRGAANDLSSVTLASLRLSIASRTHYQFNSTLSKEFYHDIAQERNRVALPAVGRDWGLRLPSEQYCLTGVGWGLKDDWDSDGEREEEGGDEVMGEQEGEGDGVEEGEERMEDVFGEEIDGRGEDMETEDE